MKNVIENINIICITIILDGVKQRICEVESRSFYTTQQEEKQRKWNEKFEESLHKLYQKKKKSCIIGVPEVEEREDGAKVYLKT